MSYSQILITAAVGLIASVVTAVVTHLLTRSQERRKYEREVVAMIANAESTKRKNMAVQYAHSCFIVEGPSPEERRRVFLPIGSRITVGSDDMCDIVIAANSVSAQAAMFKAEGDFAYTAPLGGANGIQVNGKRVERLRKLSVGDVITFPSAPFRITFVPLIK